MFNIRGLRILKNLLILNLCVCDLTFALTIKSNASATNGVLFEINRKVIGGEPISILAAHWQVSVRLKARDNPFGSGHICSGAVISSRVILSAAHCYANTAVSPWVFRNANEFKAVMGSAYLYDLTQYTLQYNVQQVLSHDKFNITSMDNDIALVFINGNIPSPHATVQPLPLNTLAPISGNKCSVSGWTTTSNGEAMLSPVLLGGTLPIMDYKVCEVTYGSNNITAGMLCVGDARSSGIEVCQGESGVPLVCNSELTGLVSWGYDCALPNYPRVYTNVTFYLPWIDFANSTLEYTYYNDAAVGVFQVKITSLLCLLSVFMILVPVNK